MTNQNDTHTHHLLTLRQIAAWQEVVEAETGESNITARIPSLQRGAVWEPQQIEMLWDSIMRGFPIGSIVISQKIERQKDKKQSASIGDSQPERETSHHILDGQQRCNAIAWGFANPWEPKISDDIVLWLDLQPNWSKNTTRKYLFRVTTKAHPWGFKTDDSASNLSTAEIGKFKEKFSVLPNNHELLKGFYELWENCQEDQNHKIKRPTPRISWPQDAVFPVPMSLLQKYFNNHQQGGDGTVDWQILAQDPWMKVITVRSNLSFENLTESERKNIESGLIMAAQTRMVALQVPNTTTAIDDIEQVFQRLNRQGTPLDNEELAYSMIKAYWPEVEEVINDLPQNRRHTTEARLVGMGIRIALTSLDSKKIEPELSVERIRTIFRSSKDSEDQKLLENIKDFFASGNFKKSLDWIDLHILYNKEHRAYGLPAYLRSSLAWSSRDVFVWLMLLAKRQNYQPINDENLVKKIAGLTLAVHWFGLDKPKAVDTLTTHSINLSDLHISEIRNKENNNPYVLVPLSVESLEKAFQLDLESSENQLSAWTSFWEGMVNRDKYGNKLDETTAKTRADRYWESIKKIRDNREMLLYQQRDYIENIFEGFDPSNKLMWKGHNRPWDFDHILASAELNGQGRGVKKYGYACQTWQNSIGNLIAVDFSFNRSAQDRDNASTKYLENKIITCAFITSAFDLKYKDTDNPEISLSFVLAVKNRLIEIYRDWYDSLLIEGLKGDAEPLN